MSTPPAVGLTKPSMARLPTDTIDHLVSIADHSWFSSRAVSVGCGLATCDAIVDFRDAVVTPS